MIDRSSLAGINAKDREAFTNLYQQHFQGLLLVSEKYVKDPGAAEEIVQDMFVRIWENGLVLEQTASLKAYLYRMAVNRSINHLKRQQNITRLHHQLAEDMSDQYIETLVEEQELKVMIYNEINKLPGQCRRVFKMSRFEGLKYREIAALLNITEKTVENHIIHALKILRKRLFVSDSGYNMQRLRLISAILYTSL